MRKILYIGGFELPDKNAAAQRVMANAKLLREMGFDVSFIGISKDILNAPKSVDGFSSAPLPYPTSVLQWMHQIFIFVESSRILKYHPNFVVLYNFPAIASMKILNACHKHGIKVIQDLTEWESNHKWYPTDIVRKIDIYLRMHYCMKKMDGIIAISRYLYDYYHTYTRTIMVPPTVDLNDSKFHRNRDLTTYGETTKLVYAGSPGKSATKDRLDYIIKAVSAFPTLRLDIVGQTKEQFIAMFGDSVAIGNNVVFHGHVSHSDAIDFVCKADFQMLIRDNSLKNNAGFPTKFVESMSCCIPVIATLTSNIGDYLHDGVNGMVVSEEHPLNEVLKKIVGMSASEKIKMKEACRAFKGFDYHNYKEVFATLFSNE